MRNKIYLIFTIIIFLIVCPASAKRPKQIMVQLQSTPYVIQGDCIYIELTYYLYDYTHDNRAKVILDPTCIGNGLVVKHNGNLLENKFTSVEEDLEVFELVSNWHCKQKVVMQTRLPSEWAKPGVLSIFYSYPWLEKVSGDHITFTSKTLLIAVLTQERLHLLEETLKKDEQLARAVYEFQNPPFGESKFARAKSANTIIKAIKVGMKQDEILFLLGSPDAVYSKDVFPQYDEKWGYTLSPVKTISIAFQNGKVTHAGTHVDWGDMYHTTGKVMDYHTGKPIDKANIVMMDSPFSAETDSEGKYAIRYIPAGTYSIFATAEGYDTLIYLNTIVCYNIWGHSPITHLDFQIKPIADSSVDHQIDSTKLHEYGTLMGEVTDEVTSHHIGGVAITLERTVSLRQNYRIKTIMHKNAHDNGEYIFLNVPIGEYQLTAELKGYNPHVYDKIVIAVDDVTTFNFSMSHYDTTEGNIPIDFKVVGEFPTENRPIAIVVDGENGNIFIANYAPYIGNDSRKVQKFDLKGKFIKTIINYAEDREGLYSYYRPVDLALDIDHNIYVLVKPLTRNLDSTWSPLQGFCVMKYDSEGNLKREYDFSEFEKYWHAAALALSDNFLFVTNGFIVKKINKKNGQSSDIDIPIAIVDSSLPKIHTTDMAVDNEGNIWLVGHANFSENLKHLVGCRIAKIDSTYESYKIFDSKTKTMFYCAGLGNPGITLDGNGNIYVATFYCGNVEIFDLDGKYLGKIDMQSESYDRILPIDVVADKYKNLYVVDMANNIVRIFKLDF